MTAADTDKSNQARDKVGLPLYSGGLPWGPIPLYEIAQELTDNLPQGKKDQETSVYYG